VDSTSEARGPVVPPALLAVITFGVVARARHEEREVIIVWALG